MTSSTGSTTQKEYSTGLELLASTIFDLNKEEIYLDFLKRTCNSINFFERNPNVVNFGQSAEIKLTFEENITLEEYIRTKKALERTILQKLIYHNDNVMAAINYFSLNPFKLKDVAFLLYLRENYLNPQTHNVISCMLNSIGYNTYGTNINFNTVDLTHPYPTPSEKVRNWFPLSNLVFQSKYLVLKLQNIPICVVRILRNFYDDFLHEAVVGMYALNNLKTEIPNFRYIYTYFHCSPPIIHFRRIAEWSSKTDDKYCCVAMENIEDSIDLDDFLKQASLEDFVRVFLQVLNALELAYQRYEFTHYDLYCYNVLVRTLKEEIAIPFYFSETTTKKSTPVKKKRLIKEGGHEVEGTISTFLVSKYIAYIVDYNSSRIKINYTLADKEGQFYLEKKHFGRSTFKYDKPFPMFDLYKLLLSLGEVIINNPKLALEKRNLLDFLSKCFDIIFNIAEEKKIFVQRTTLEEKVRTKLSLTEFYYLPSELATITFKEYFSKFKVLLEKDFRDSKNFIVKSSKVRNKITYPFTDADLKNKICLTNIGIIKINNLEYSEAKRALEKLTPEKLKVNIIKEFLFSKIEEPLHPLIKIQNLLHEYSLEVRRFLRDVNWPYLFFNDKVLLLEPALFVIAPENLQTVTSCLFDDELMKRYLGFFNCIFLIKDLKQEIFQARFFFYVLKEKSNYHSTIFNKFRDVFIRNQSSMIELYYKIISFNLKIIFSNKELIIKNYLSSIEDLKSPRIELQEFYRFRNQARREEFNLNKFISFLKKKRSLGEHLYNLIHQLENTINQTEQEMQNDPLFRNIEQLNLEDIKKDKDSNTSEVEKEIEKVKNLMSNHLKFYTFISKYIDFRNPKTSISYHELIERINFGKALNDREILVSKLLPFSKGELESILREIEKKVKSLSRQQKLLSLEIKRDYVKRGTLTRLRHLNHDLEIIKKIYFFKTGIYLWFEDLYSKVKILED